MIAIEVAIAAGCAAYCGGVAYARAVVEMADAIGAGIVTAAQTLEAVGDVVGGLAAAFAETVIVRPVLRATILLDVSNWRIGGMPASSRADLLVSGLYFSSQLRGDDFDALLSSVARRIRSYPAPAPALVTEILTAVNAERRELGEEPLAATLDQVLDSAPWQFIQMLYDEGYVEFEQDPDDIVDLTLGHEPE